MIEVRNLCKTYAQEGGNRRAPVRALEDISLRIEEREFVSIIGPSGCGKTTLLKILAGLVPYDSGAVEIDGRPVEGPGPDRRVVFQNFALLPWRTVLSNVEFGLEVKGVPATERGARAKHQIELVGLGSFESAYPHELSGGMQQRVGLARALVMNPKTLLMDEPFGSLDAQTRLVLQRDLLELWDRDRKTVVFVTHAMDEAVYLSDRIVIMSARPGRIVDIRKVDLPRPRGEPTGARADPRFVELTSYIWDRLAEAANHTTGVASGHR